MVRVKTRTKTLVVRYEPMVAKVPGFLSCHGGFSKKERPQRRGAGKVKRRERLIRSAGAPKIPGLEADAEPELHLPGRVVSATSVLPWQGAEGRRIAGVDVITGAGILELDMVKKVGDDELRLKVDPLGNHELLLQAEVHVPVWEPAQNAEATITGIQTQNGLPDVVISGCGVGEQVDPETGVADAVRPIGIMHPDAGKLSNRDGVFRDPIAKEVSGVTFAEGLATAIDGAQSDGQAAAGGEYRCKCPAAKQMPGQAVLPLIP